MTHRPYRQCGGAKRFIVSWKFKPTDQGAFDADVHASNRGAARRAFAAMFPMNTIVDVRPSTRP